MKVAVTSLPSSVAVPVTSASAVVEIDTKVVESAVSAVESALASAICTDDTSSVPSRSATSVAEPERSAVTAALVVARLV